MIHHEPSDNDVGRDENAADFRCRPGEILDGRFRIVREVAQGGMGVVYEAIDQRLDRRIALKLAKPHYRQRLTPEVRNASEISHPNICRIFEIHTARTPRGEVDFITMEFVEGKTLARRLRQGPLAKPEGRAIALQLCAGLAEAHRKGVIHGDLKPANVILTQDADGGSRAVITDFGLASSPRAALDAAKPGATGGTPGYMAPELWKGQTASAASDIFALGVILYQIAAGRMPHADPPVVDRDASTVTMPLRADPRTIWEGRLRNEVPVSPQWDRILRRCLELDPAKRFANADEVANALGPSRLRRRLLAAAAAAVLVLATGAITYDRASAPRETVSLSVLPVEADSATAAVAPRLMRETEAKLAKIGSSKGTRFELAKTGGTHTLRVKLEDRGGRVALRTVVTDDRTQVNLREWSADYASSETRYAPAAIAGVVTWTFRLPALPEGKSVGEAARQDYEAALRSLHRASQLDAALAGFERAAAADPESALTWTGLAEAQWFKYSSSNHRAWYDRARESLRRAQVRNPDFAAVHSLAGVLRMDEGRYELAMSEYHRALDLDPGNAVVFRRMGQALRRNSQMEEALAALQRAIALDAADYRNYLSLADYWNQRGNRTAALEAFLKAASQAPQESVVHYGIGSQYEILGRFAEAERELAKSLALHETAEALSVYGEVLYFQGRCRDAIPYVRRSVELNPANYQTWLQLGVCYRLLGDIANAGSAFRTGLTVVESEVAQNPRNGRDRSYLAYFCAQLGDRRRAEAETAQALQLSPEDVNALQAALWTREVLGQREASLALAAGFSANMLAELDRRPELKNLREDPRFLRLFMFHQSK